MPPHEKDDFLRTSDLTESDIRFILSTAKVFSEVQNRGEAFPALLAGTTVVNFFLENSTRTRISFELATRKLGGGVVNFSADSSSLGKGESLLDTAQTLSALKADCIVVRHTSAGSPKFLADQLSIPIVNAGDGFHEHPTQAMLDAYTIEEEIGSLKGKRVLIIGDIAHSRVARSNIHVLKKLGASISVCGPPTLMPPSPEILGVDYAFRPEELIPQADVIMMLRIQSERHNQTQIPSLSEYAEFWGLNKQRLKLVKPKAIILHPGPINRGVELDSEVADDPRAMILNQVSNGILVRMVVLARCAARQKLNQWLKSQGRISA